MPEFEGFKIVYEVVAMPKGKWTILVEIIRREDGKVLAAHHNPFPEHPFDTKLEALDQVNRYIAQTIADQERAPGTRRIA